MNHTVRPFTNAPAIITTIRKLLSQLDSGTTLLLAQQFNAANGIDSPPDPEGDVLVGIFSNIWNRCSSYERRCLLTLMGFLTVREVNRIAEQGLLDTPK